MSASSLSSSGSMFSVLDTEMKVYGEQGNKRGYFPKCWTVPLKSESCLSAGGKLHHLATLWMLHALCVNNTWMKLQLCEQICTSDYLNKEMLIITVWICREKFWVPLKCVCVRWRGLCLRSPPTWIEPSLVQSTAVSFEKPKNKKSLKSSALPLSCVHLIRLFLTSLSLHSAPVGPGAAACYHAELNLWSTTDSLASSECFWEGKKKNLSTSMCLSRCW